MSVGGPVERYLAEVARVLPGPPLLRRDVLDELRDGLSVAVERRPAVAREVAEREAVEEFGPARELGQALATELRRRLARRAAIGAGLVLLAMHVAWQTYGQLVGFPSATVPDGADGGVFLLVVAAVQLLPIGVVLATAVVVLAASRSRSVWRGVGVVAALVARAATWSVIAAVLAGVVLITPGYRWSAAASAVPTVALLSVIATLLGRAGRHLRIAGSS